MSTENDYNEARICGDFRAAAEIARSLSEDSTISAEVAAMWRNAAEKMEAKLA